MIEPTRICLLMVGLIQCLGMSAISHGQSVLTTPNDSTTSVNDSTAATPNPVRAQQGRTSAVRTYDNTGSNEAAPLPAPFPAKAARPSRTVGPLNEKSEFETFVESSTGRHLPVFGRQLFDQVPTTFAPLERVPVPADYVLGPGDELLIRAWGKIDLDAHVTLDRNGQIYLPKVGVLNVAGLRSQQVEGYLHTAIGALFKDFDLNVSLGQLRSIQILVLGNARRPGAYTIGSLSTLVNAIFVSGGPSSTGTMRRVQLLRARRLVTVFDLYDLAQLGDLSHDVQLLPGDVIYIPPVGAQIAISGDVNIPGLYELKGQTTLADALGAAGGLTNLADTARVSLERLENHKSRRLEEFPLDVSGLARPMEDGDLLRIFPLSPKFQNTVTLRGNVAQPGRYVWSPGMRISELIPTRELLITRAYWNRQNQLVPESTTNPFGNSTRRRVFDKTHQQGGMKDDSSEIDQDRGSKELSDSEPVIEGQDRPFDEPLKTADSLSPQDARSDPPIDPTDRAKNLSDSMIASIGRNSAEVNWEYAVIERLDEHDLSTRLIPFCLARAIDDPGSVDNQTLLAGDVVTIFSRSDLELPIEKRASFVRVGGEVNAPGMYRVEPGENLRELVRQAGGLTSHSYLYAAFFTRLSTRLVEEEQLRQSTEQMQRELISRYANATPAPGQSGLDQQAQLAMQQAALARLASTMPTGRVVLEMKADAIKVDDLPDLPLEDGDILYIPPRLSTVQVTGAVYNANAFRHQPGRPLTTYLDAAGGVTREADQKRTFVIRADGSVVSRQSRIPSVHGGFEHLVLLPGDAIVVPAKLKVSSKIDSLLQATQFMSQTALTAASLSVIK